MRRPLTPVPALLSVLCLLFALSACGEKTEAESSGAGLDAVSVSGEFGTAPQVKWEDQAAVDELESETVIEGDGDKVAKGDEVIAHIWIGNGFTKKQAFTTYSGASAGPEALTVDESSLNKAIYTAAIDHTIGSRVLVVAPPKDAFGEQGNSQMGIGNADTVVFVVDLLQKALTGPSGTEVKPSADAPSLLLEGDQPTGFEFTKAPAQASDELQVFPLIKGDGDKVAQTDTVKVDYLGSVYGSKEVFDESFTKAPFAAGMDPEKCAAAQNCVIEGWQKGLVGQTVGSRVILSIPSEMAYGEAGSGETIPPNADLVFVVDILAAY